MKFQAFLSTAIFALSAPLTFAAPSAPKSEPKTSPEVIAYNKGVDLLMKKEFAPAAKQFTKALSERESFAEAHNNLAFALRKQGSENYSKSLEHYNRAIELDSDLAEAYMYRGVLHVAMGNPEAAKADHTKLRKLDPSLAQELQHVIDTGSEKSPEQFFGVTEKL